MHCNKSARSPCLRTASLSGEQYSFRPGGVVPEHDPAEHLPRGRTSGGAVAFQV
jgi:hypothetical protein